ncbi:hypothetical protein HYW82_02525 [Candidatus Peregrinibacteria bacterium]|nr:hypothetical protein [Candidatus Peregrinibacteria bacterium]
MESILATPAFLGKLFPVSATGESIGALFGPIYLVLGLSLLIYAGPWKNLIGGWRKDHLGLFTLMFVDLILGLFLITQHNVWAWNGWVFITLAGWCMLVKSVIYFLLPGSVIKSLLKLGENTALIYISGVAATVVGAFYTYWLYLA